MAGNNYTNVQAVVVKYKKGSFWATQYHPEYDLYEISRLILARKEKLIKSGIFLDEEALKSYVFDMESLYKDNSRKDLSWKLGIDEDILDFKNRTMEFNNWLTTEVGLWFCFS